MVRGGAKLVCTERRTIAHTGDQEMITDRLVAVDELASSLAAN